MSPVLNNRVDSTATKTQTTFLTLPRELRQAILLETYDQHADTRPFTTFKDGSDSVTFNLYFVDATGKLIRPVAHVASWCELLSCVHPTIKEDLVFVKERWAEDIKSAKPNRSMALARRDYAREKVSGDVVLWKRVKRGRRMSALRRRLDIQD